MSVTIRGEKELMRRLGRLRRDLQGKTLHAAAKAAGVVIRDEARRRAPRVSGTLSENIDIEVRRGRLGITVRIGLRKIGKVFRAFYGLFVELGTTLAAAKPFLRPAFDSHRGKALRVFGEVIRRAVERVGA